MSNVYFNALNNIEILTNITLSHLKANIILNKEKKRLNIEIRDNKLHNKIAIDIKYMFGFIGNSLGYLLGGFLGSTVGNTLTSVVLEISPIFKFITGLLMVSIIYSKFKY